MRSRRSLRKRNKNRSRYSKNIQKRRSMKKKRFSKKKRKYSYKRKSLRGGMMEGRGPTTRRPSGRAPLTPNKEALLSQFMSYCRCSRESAQAYLEKYGWNPKYVEAVKGADRKMILDTSEIDEMTVNGNIEAGVASLKQSLGERGLPIGGNKSKLRKRLKDFETIRSGTCEEGMGRMSADAGEDIPGPLWSEGVGQIGVPRLVPMGPRAGDEFGDEIEGYVDDCCGGGMDWGFMGEKLYSLSEGELKANCDNFKIP